VSDVGPSISTPPRVPGSTRRTTSIEMDTSHGLVLIGRARDLVTPRRGDAVVVVDEASFTARVGDYLRGQIIEELSASPTIAGLDTMLGRSASRGYRRELQRLADEQGLVGRAIFQLLDDVPGTALVSGYSPELNRRDGNLPERRTADGAAGGAPGHLLALTGVCAGWQEGGAIVTNVLEVGHVPIAVGPEAPSLDRADDPLAWHELPDPIPPHGMRRRRRIDVVPPASSQQGVLTIDAMFRDSYVTADRVETVVHEYTFTADVDPVTHVVLRAEAVPRALPFAQCPEAGASAERLAGDGLDDLRARIRAEFVGPSTCTHLNDMLRALADVGYLAARVGAAGA
jgi:hypothetical protein